MIFKIIFIKFDQINSNKTRYSMKFLKFSLIVSMFFIFVQLSAQETGIYLGGGVGTSFINHTLELSSFDDVKFDENNFAYKIFAGYRANKFLSFEGGYRNTGKAEDKTTEHTISTTTKGWDIEAVGIIDISILYAFAKAGAFFWNTENVFGQEIFKENETGFLWGVGAGINLSGLAVRLEWESLGTTNPESISMLTAGVTFGF